jgi:hypothetical protein
MPAAAIAQRLAADHIGVLPAMQVIDLTTPPPPRSAAS